MIPSQLAPPAPANAAVGPQTGDVTRPDRNGSMDSQGGKSFSEILAADLGTNTASQAGSGTAKGAQKPTALKAPIQKDAASARPAAFAIPFELQQLLDDASADEAAPAAMSGGVPGSTTGQAAGKTGDTAPATASSAATTAAAPLAFAMLISADGDNAEAANPRAISASPDAAAFSMELQHAASSVTVTAAQGPADSTAEHSSDPQSNPLAAPIGEGETEHAAGDRFKIVEQPGAMAASDLDGAADASRNEAVRNVRLQLEGDNNQRIDIRLTDQGGAVYVSVRSADANLTQALQDHMPRANEPPGTATVSRRSLDSALVRSVSFRRRGFAQLSFAEARHAGPEQSRPQAEWTSKQSTGLAR